MIFTSINALFYLKYARHVNRFRRKVGYLPNIACPKRYNEMMLWRKLFDHNPAFITFSDKLATKTYITERCPNLAVLQPIWIGKDPAKIPQDVLENTMVIKANHGCGWNHFHAADQPLARALSRTAHSKMQSWVTSRHGTTNMEWANQHSEKTLFCEPSLGSISSVRDLSVHAGNAEVFVLEYIVANKTDRQQKAYFSPDGTRYREIERSISFEEQDPYLPDGAILPPQFLQAMEHAKTLSANIDYARFDFMLADNVLYGGEITVYPASGLTNATKFAAYNALMEDKWDIEQSRYFQTPGGIFKKWYPRLLRSNRRPFAR